MEVCTCSLIKRLPWHPSQVARLLVLLDFVFHHSCHRDDSPKLRTVCSLSTKHTLMIALEPSATLADIATTVRRPRIDAGDFPLSEEVWPP